MERNFLISSLLLLVLSCCFYSQDLQATLVIDNAHVYERPTRRSKIIATLPKGAEVAVLSEITINDYYMVSFFGGAKEGWLYKTVLKIERPDVKSDDEVTTEGWSKAATAMFRGFQIRFLLDPKRMTSKDGQLNFWIKKYPLLSKAEFIADYYDNVVKREMPAGVDPTDFEYILEYWQADCAAQRSGVVQVIESYRNFGVVSSPINYDPRLSPVVPESVGEAVLRRVCSIE